jgi:uncharacterized protein (DUF1697 family)
VTHIAFLRAVNVGGRAVVKMADLKAAFERAGCKRVQTFIASGNVVFDAPAKLPPALRARITRELVTLLGVEPGVCYRTLDEIEALIAAAPFGRMFSDPALKLYVAFMDRVPAVLPKLPVVVEKERLEITAIRAADALVVSRRKPNGMYGFPNACVEALGVVATSRNWNTVARVAAFAQQARSATRRCADPAEAAPARAGRGGRAGTRSRAS